MARMVTRESNLSVDLECGRKTIEEEALWDTVTGGRHTTKLFGRVWSGYLNLDGSVKDEGGLTSCDGSNSCDKLSNFSEVSIESVEFLADNKMLREENLGILEKNAGSEIPKKKISKKPPRPPRPPKSSLVLDAADQKMVREISELAMLKRARSERMKALKKTKANKQSSSSSNLCAMAITILFVLVLILQAL